MSGRGMPRPRKRLAALRAKKQSGEIDQSLLFAKWLIERADRRELPQLSSWIEASKPRDLAEIIRQYEMMKPPKPGGRLNWP
jgi:hypothetical protein